MFKFLKEKLGSVVKKFSKDVEEEAEQIETHEETKEVKKAATKQQEKTSVKKHEEKKTTKTDDKKHYNVQEKDREEEKQIEKLKSKKIIHEAAHKEEHTKTKDKLPVPAKEKSGKEKKEEISKKPEQTSKSTITEEQETVELEIKEEQSTEKPKKGFFSKIFRKEKHQSDGETTEKIIEEKSTVIETAKHQESAHSEITDEPESENENLQQVQEEDDEQEESQLKRGFFTKVSETFTKIHLSEEKFEELFWELEIMLLENNVAVEVISKIKEDLKLELMSDKISRKNVEEIIKDSLRKSLEEILDIKGFSLEDKIKSKKPFIIAVIGVNGSGKTTTIAKLCHLLKKQNHTVVLAAADTFRAAAIQQLEHHADKLNIKMIKHDYNSDPAAVAFDAVKHAEAKNIDVVVIDTAGRLHSNDNLMNELKKLIKVNKPDLKLFVGESITGNDCVEQAKVYDEIIGIDAIILSKADIDEKGGAALSISYVTKKPVLFVGTGQTYDDLKPFSKKDIMDGLGF